MIRVKSHGRSPHPPAPAHLSPTQAIPIIHGRREDAVRTSTGRGQPSLSHSWMGLKGTSVRRGGGGGGAIPAFPWDGSRAGIVASWGKRGGGVKPNYSKLLGGGGRPMLTMKGIGFGTGRWGH